MKKKDIMTINDKTKKNGEEEKSISKELLKGCTREELMHVLRLMYTSRAMDH